jgi:hypothetical protein
LINDEFGEPHDLKFDLVFTEQGFHIYWLEYRDRNLKISS